MKKDLRFPPGPVKTGQDVAVELLQVFKVFDKNGFQDLCIKGLVIVKGDVPEANHGWHLLGEGFGNDFGVFE